nr:ABC transporter ATP-binding protein [Martelella sp. HB161492]
MWKAYGDTKVLHSVSLDVQKGEFLALLGPSGCGKTTLLRMISGLLQPNGGMLKLNGKTITDVPANRRGIGLVFQNYALFPHMSVAENVGYGLRMRKVAKTEIAANVKEALDLVKLTHLGERMPSELSGGQQQRVALARALAIKPQLLLLDEPLSNLDAVLRTSVRAELLELHNRTGLTTIMVTHDQAEAMTLADRIVVLNNGHVLQHDAPQAIYEQPQHAFVSTFVGSPPASLLEVTRRVDGGYRLEDTNWDAGSHLSQKLAEIKRRKYHLGLRPEELSFSAEGALASLPCAIRTVEYLGAERLVHVDVGTQKLIVRLGRSDTLPSTPGHIYLQTLPPIFDTEDGRRLG